MERVEDNVAEKRALTDASLGAERASTDADFTQVTAQRTTDALVDGERLLADERLRSLRNSADRLLTSHRAASPIEGVSIAVERQAADEGTRAERQIMDSLLEKERRRADTILDAGRRESAAHRARDEIRRRDTNDQLCTERIDADAAALEHDETKTALAHAQSEQAHRSDAFGMVTHDLRSPLSVIVLNAQTVLECTQEAPTREALRDITRAAARMDGLLTDLLDVARMESGTLRISKLEHDVGTLVTEVMQTYRHIFAQRGLAFTAEPPPVTTVASFDYDRIVQVLSNLISNALKFTPACGTVCLHAEKRKGDVEFALRNSGPGIDSENLPHLFKQFWQVDSDARRGLGLGLYICQKIVQAHDGRIWAESESGKSATFRFTLPANQNPKSVGSLNL